MYLFRPKVHILGSVVVGASFHCIHVQEQERAYIQDNNLEKLTVALKYAFIPMKTAGVTDE